MTCSDDETCGHRVGSGPADHDGATSCSSIAAATLRQGNADASRPQAAHAASSVETPQANESARWRAGPEEVRVARQQWLIFASGQRLSRELFRELSQPDGPSELDAFKAFMDASMALGGRRA